MRYIITLNGVAPHPIPLPNGERGGVRGIITGGYLSYHNPRKAFWITSALRSSLPVPWWMVLPV
jgi:hypothetical protein